MMIPIEVADLADLEQCPRVPWTIGAWRFMGLGASAAKHGEVQGPAWLRPTGWEGYLPMEGWQADNCLDLKIGFSWINIGRIL